jgi:hypothetical protein
MAHKTRAEQLAIKARKDPKRLAKKTKAHKPKTEYKRRYMHLVTGKIWSEEEYEEVNDESND